MRGRESWTRWQGCCGETRAGHRRRSGTLGAGHWQQLQAMGMTDWRREGSLTAFGARGRFETAEGGPPLAGGGSIGAGGGSGVIGGSQGAGGVQGSSSIVTGNIAGSVGIELDATADGGPYIADNLHLIEGRVGAATLSGIVKVHTTHCYPNYSLPWQKLRQYQTTSSGFVIDTKRRWILTNAHSVQHHTVVRVKRHGSDSKFTATVLSEAFDCDLALLTVKDEGFWDGVEKIPFGPAPHLQQAVTVIGYPVGGENISVTTGVIDAAINSGNSGGPTINDHGELVGIAFQSLSPRNAENIGYIIATSVARHFLEDYAENGRYTGFCDYGFDWQKMENSHLRESLGMKPAESGILIRRVEATHDSCQRLKKDDVVLDFDGTKISNDGTVEYRKGERVGFNYLVSNKFVNDTCDVTILRNKERIKIHYRLSAVSGALLVPPLERRREPEYFTVAGLVFVVLSEPYLRSEYGDRWDYDSPVRLLDKLFHGKKTEPDEQVVILSQVLDAEISSGYEFITNTIVLKFNSVPVRCISQLASLVEASEEKYMRFDLDYDEVIVLETAISKEASKEILEQHGIPKPKSVGMLPDTVDSPMTSSTRGEEKEKSLKQDLVSEDSGKNKTDGDEEELIPGDISCEEYTPRDFQDTSPSMSGPAEP